MGVGDRILQLRTERGWSQEELAKRVKKLGGEISQTGIDKIEKRNSKRPRYTKEIAEAFGVYVEYLLHGKGPVHRLNFDDEPPALYRVPILSWVSAGAMVQPDISSLETDSITLAGLDPTGDWIALRVDGDSMNKISPRESIIVLNRRDKRLVPNGCYVLADPDGNATYKRFRPGPPPQFSPVSTDSNYDAIFPDHEPVVVGRVRWSILKM